MRNVKKGAALTMFFKLLSLNLKRVWFYDPGLLKHNVRVLLSCRDAWKARPRPILVLTHSSRQQPAEIQSSYMVQRTDELKFKDSSDVKRPE